MASQQRSRRSACREELCARLGYCGDSRWLEASDLEGDTPDAVVESVLAVEGLDPTTVDSHQRTQIRAVVVDWLFDPHGRGERSDLPH
jgi:hypothetical protein